MKLGDNGEAFFVQETEQHNVSFIQYAMKMKKNLMLIFSCLLVEINYCISMYNFLTQEIVPAHLVTSPIPTEGVLFRSREPRCGGSVVETSTTLSPEDPATGNTQTCSSSAGKKKKRRRRKHKAELRKEEQATSPAGGELELCELSSDEEPSAHNGR